MPVTNETNGKVYTSVDELARLEYKASGFSLLPHQPVSSILSGRHTSRLRGRGLNFEEIRDYFPGDDTRHIDWKVTARTRKPHVRVYTEERDRPVVLVVDQRISMFFGTKLYMKSVAAAHVAALAAWRAFHSGDRAGAIVFNDSDVKRITPHRSRGRVLEILGAIDRQNRELRADSPTQSNPQMLNEALRRANLMAGHDNLVIIVSDFAGATGETRQAILDCVQHNDVVAALIFDPSARQMPQAIRLVVTQGELQVELNLAEGKIGEPLYKFSTGRLESVEKFLKKLAIPVVPIDAGEEPVDQLRRLIGGIR